jgi:hypothetical protein
LAEFREGTVFLSSPLDEVPGHCDYQHGGDMNITRAWATSHRTLQQSADDSRESIYADRGG